ncbi:hypothetical protein CONPUDRAFT_64173, partial [Coniophora puteana RWD-64-598 SS2]
SQPTDYGSFVTKIVTRMVRESGAVDQDLLRRAIGLSSSYMVTDASTNTQSGIDSWKVGFITAIDTVVALHHRGELELETVNEASKACSECWSVAGTWRGMDACRSTVREVASKLRRILDEPNHRTYRGEKVYAPAR